MGDTTKEKIKIVAEITIILTSILGAIGVIINFYSYFTEWFIYLFALFIILLITWIVYTPLSIFVKCKIVKVRGNKVACEFFEEFKELVDGMNDFLKPHNSYNIPYVLECIKGVATGYNADTSSQIKAFESITIPDNAPLNDLLYSFKEMIKRFDGTKEEFFIFVRMFNQIMMIYNKNICEPVKEIKKVEERIPDNIREKYIKHRDEYNRFMDKYRDFGKIVNKTFNYAIVKTTFDTPESI